MSQNWRNTSEWSAVIFVRSWRERRRVTQECFRTGSRLEAHSDLKRVARAPRTVGEDIALTMTFRTGSSGIPILEAPKIPPLPGLHPLGASAFSRRRLRKRRKKRGGGCGQNRTGDSILCFGKGSLLGI